MKTDTPDKSLELALAELTDSLRIVRRALKKVKTALEEDAQLANVDLQNTLQKQQQLLQMLSSISKTFHDAEMAILRKIGGG